MLVLAAPYDPALFNRMRDGRVPARIEEREGRPVLVAPGCWGYSDFVDPSAAVVGTEGLAAFVDRRAVFLDPDDLAAEGEKREEAARRRAAAAVERQAEIERTIPVEIPPGASPLDALMRVRDRRFAYYRRRFATAEVEGTYEMVYPAQNALVAWIEALREALPFPTAVRRAINTFRGGWNDGANHIVCVEGLSAGRLSRRPGDPLCRKAARFFELADEDDGASCVTCARIAERILDPAPRAARTSRPATASRLPETTLR